MKQVFFDNQQLIHKWFSLGKPGHIYYCTRREVWYSGKVEYKASNYFALLEIVVQQRRYPAGWLVPDKL